MLTTKLKLTMDPTHPGIHQHHPAWQPSLRQLRPQRPCAWWGGDRLSALRPARTCVLFSSLPPHLHPEVLAGSLPPVPGYPSSSLLSPQPGEPLKHSAGPPAVTRRVSYPSNTALSSSHSYPLWQVPSLLVYPYYYSQASLVAQMVKNPPAMQETQVQSLGQEDPLEKEMATHSSPLAWEIPWTEEPGGLHSPWGHRVRHGWSN